MDSRPGTGDRDTEAAASLLVSRSCVMVDRLLGPSGRLAKTETHSNSELVQMGGLRPPTAQLNVIRTRNTSEREDESRVKKEAVLQLRPSVDDGSGEERVFFSSPRAVTSWPRDDGSWFRRSRLHSKQGRA